MDVSSPKDAAEEIPIDPHGIVSRSRFIQQPVLLKLKARHGVSTDAEGVPLEGDS